MRDIHISIVSHAQNKLVNNLLYDIEALTSSSRCLVTITHNVPDKIADPYLEATFPIKIINNTFPKGFSANHNYAFKSALHSKGQQFFFIINPDVRFAADVIMQVINKLKENENIGLAAPIVFGTDNALEDSIRYLPTPRRILAKLFGDQGSWDDVNELQPDWVAGMFMAFKSDAFNQINGFNEKFFLYYEDVDICSRLWLQGYTIEVVKEASVVHDAQRTSRRNLKYLYWHLSSMFRFFNSETYRKAKLLHRQRYRNN